MVTDIRIKALLSNIQESFDGSPWYGISVMEKLNGFDWNFVNLIPQNGKKSVVQLLAHIINWRVFVLKKLQGDTDFDIEMNSEADWPKIVIKNEEEWNKLQTELQRTQTELLKFLDGCEDGWLETKVPGKDYNFHYLLKGISQHDTYHLGQIGLLYGMLK